MDFASSRASERYREWLRGEHREIVAMPDDPPEQMADALDRIA